MISNKYVAGVLSVEDFIYSYNMTDWIYGWKDISCQWYDEAFTGIVLISFGALLTPKSKSNPHNIIDITVLKLPDLWFGSALRFQNINVSRLVLQLSLPNPLSQVLSRGWRCSWSIAYRQCFNNIWVINNFIGATCIRGLTVHLCTHVYNVCLMGRKFSDIYRME